MWHNKLWTAHISTQMCLKRIEEENPHWYSNDKMQAGYLEPRNKVRAHLLIQDSLSFPSVSFLQVFRWLLRFWPFWQDVPCWWDYGTCHALLVAALGTCKVVSPLSWVCPFREFLLEFVFSQWTQLYLSITGYISTDKVSAYLFSIVTLCLYF